MTSLMKYLMPYMITQINNSVNLIDVLQEYERTSLTNPMRSFLLYFEANHVYPKGTQYVLNEWKGFKVIHEQSKSSKKINKTSKEKT